MSPARYSTRLATTVTIAGAVLGGVGVGASTPLHATQGPAPTDIYLVQVEEHDGRWRFGRPMNVTDRNGYDNQPWFTPDGEHMLFTSYRDGQADTYRYEIRTDRVYHVIGTRKESEYSPMLMPDGEHVSVVRVEQDSTQRLWRFRADGLFPEVLLPDIAPVGYYTWADDRTLALFVLGDPPTLHLADVRTGRDRVVVENIGRSIHKVPGREAVSFLHREAGGAWIKELDLATGEVRTLIEPMGDNEFYAWTPDGALVMGLGSKLYRWRPGEDVAWLEVADFAGHGVTDISRVAVSPQGNYVAVVGSRR